jgi:AhpD family alkylhydroperoxidase
MALAIAIAIRGEGCTPHHVNAAMKHGASRQEAVETIAVAIEMGDGPLSMARPHARCSTRPAQHDLDYA